MHYERNFYGPGNIGDMPSGYGLTRPPTISSNDRPRNIPSLQGCSGCMGDNGDTTTPPTASASVGSIAPILVPVALGALAYYLFFHTR
jgi:hypothetical protein